MVRTHEFEPCFDERRTTCLMCREDRFCNALGNTEDCAFYKDKTSMTDHEIAAYWEELWKDDYKAATINEQNRLAEIGIKIRKEYERRGLLQ